MQASNLTHMRDFYVFKVGDTLPTLRSKLGDFEDWIVAGMGLGRQDVIIFDARQAHSLPPYETLAGLVITGSHAMVTERLPWSERLAAWLPGAVAKQVPILGICYGHQLLAHALGGTVGDNPQGREFGTVTVTFNECARADQLFGDLPHAIQVHASHTQSVLELPHKARPLAVSERDSHQAFVVGDRVWGVQFHPEFNAEVVKTYIQHHQATLEAEGQDPKQILRACEATPYGDIILRRFGEIVKRLPSKVTTQVAPRRG